MPKYYDRDTKVADVQQIEEGKLKASQAARDLGVAEQTIYYWIKELRTDSKAGCRISEEARKGKQLATEGG